MERDRDYKVLGTSILIVGVIILANFLGNLYVLNNQQEQIDELVKKNHVQDLRLKILEQI
jgi:hypothetical protein